MSAGGPAPLFSATTVDSIAEDDESESSDESSDGSSSEEDGE